VIILNDNAKKNPNILTYYYKPSNGNVIDNYIISSHNFHNIFFPYHLG